MDSLYGRIRAALARPGATADAGLVFHAQYRPMGDTVAPATKPAATKDEERTRAHPWLRERRWFPNNDGSPRPTDVVEIDGLASGANRCEAAVLDATADGGILSEFPVTTLRSDVGDVRIVVTDLQAPHRIADAYFRGAPVRDGAASETFETSAPGRALARTNMSGPHDELFRHAPASLLYGYWNAARSEHTNDKGKNASPDLTPKQYVSPQHAGRAARSYTTRLYGTDPLVASAAGVRWDPSVRASTDDDGNAKRKKKLSEWNLGMIPWTAAATAVHVTAVHRYATLSFAQLCALRLDPLGQDARTAVRAFLAALGVWSDRAAWLHGVSLRSGCDLAITSDETAFVRDLDNDAPVGIDARVADALLADALSGLTDAGVGFGPGLELSATPTVIDAVRMDGVGG